MNIFKLSSVIFLYNLIKGHWRGLMWFVDAVMSYPHKRQLKVYRHINNAKGANIMANSNAARTSVFTSSFEDDAVFNEKAQTSALTEKKSSEMFIRVGYVAGVDEEGNEVFIDLPIGRNQLSAIIADNLEEQPVTGSTDELQFRSAARNEFLRQLKDRLNNLKPGETEILGGNIRVQLARAGTKSTTLDKGVVNPYSANLFADK